MNLGKWRPQQYIHVQKYFFDKRERTKHQCDGPPTTSPPDGESTIESSPAGDENEARPYTEPYPLNQLILCVYILKGYHIRMDNFTWMRVIIAFMTRSDKRFVRKFPF